MSVKEYTAHRGLSSVRSVTFALKTGRITRSPEGWIDSEKADRDWEQNTNPRRSAASKANGAIGQALRRRRTPRAAFAPLPPAPESGPATAGQPPADIGELAKARTVREKYAALLAKLDYEEKSGKLISRAEVETTAYTRDHILRDLILSVPDRLSAELAAETDGAIVHRLLEAELRSVLEKVAAMKTVAAPRRGAAVYGNVG